MDWAHASSSQEKQRILDRLCGQFDQVLRQLSEAKPFAKSSYQTELFQIAEAMMAAPEGLLALYERAAQFDAAGVFEGGPWVDPSKLLPHLVAGGLKAQGVYPIVETLSELRMLALAQGRYESPTTAAEEARAFLTETLALNLAFLFPGHTEQERIEGGVHGESNIRLFRLLAEELGLADLDQEVLGEIEQICAQRPIMTRDVRSMIEMACRIPADHLSGSCGQRLQLFVEAIQGPTPLSREFRDLARYRKAIQAADGETLRGEAHDFAASMHRTGLVAEHHAALLRHVTRKAPEGIPAVLGLDASGEAEFGQHVEFVRKMIKASLFPATAQHLYGFSLMLSRSLLSRSEVRAGIEKLVELDLHASARQKLQSLASPAQGLSANALLTAGCFSVLGQPLGLGQGNNPTCQAARGISLWSQHAPGYLLEMLISAARDDFVQMAFEGQSLRSDLLPSNTRMLDLQLDPVSLLLVPHLDRLYEALMAAVALRPEDGHKWVNPALYGRWVPTGFASVFADVAQTTIVDYPSFARRFFATYHPAYNDDNPIMYANPVGLCITNSHGDYLGPHAVSLQRVDEDPEGHLRAYFFNPNNEGRQNWGRGVCPSVSGYGEEPGESSLPFNAFAARLYAFHYNPYEEGDGFAVEREQILEIEEQARETWGRSFQWS